MAKRSHTALMARHRVAHNPVRQPHIHVLDEFTIAEVPQHPRKPSTYYVLDMVADYRPTLAIALSAVSA